MNQPLEPNLFINREVSLLAFNERVLAQALDEQTPLLERLKFLCISSTNLDEFFEIRISGLKQKVMAGIGAEGPDNLTPADVLKQVSERAHSLVAQQYNVLNTVVLPKLEQEGIRVIGSTVWSPEQAAWIENYFRTEVLPVLSPLGLDPAHPFPRVINKSLNFIVSLEGRDAFGRNVDIAIVPAPRSLPRLVRLPAHVASVPNEFVSLASVIRANVGVLFSDMQVTGSYQFRVTRNSELFIDEEEIDDLLAALEGELPSRRYGDSVRLEVEDSCPENFVEFLTNHFELTATDVYRVNGPVNLNRLLAIYDMVDRQELKYPAFLPTVPRQLANANDVFEVLRQSDVLLHHPFESFVPILELLRQAALDPHVLVIKQTLYRTGMETVLADYLVQAAQMGKEVTVVIELRARFDEEANISLATKLQEAGVHVVYGVVGYKTHCKMLMVVRREGDYLRRYVHLGTGNYHTKTARLYTDYGFLTSDKKIGEDVHKLFLQLTGLGHATKLNKLLQSPFTLQKALLEKIDREIEAVKAGKPAHVMAKMNALTDPTMIEALYKASLAGVKIDLIVRGTCCLRAGVPGLSENITVRSIVGRFLEHERAYCFYNQGENEVFLSSADWMTRNLSQRVEVAFPIEDPVLKQRVLTEIFDNDLQDTTAWILQPDTTYHRENKEKILHSAQQHLMTALVIKPH